MTSLSFVSDDDNTQGASDDWNNGGEGEEEIVGEEKWRRDRYEREKYLQEKQVPTRENFN